MQGRLLSNDVFRRLSHVCGFVHESWGITRARAYSSLTRGKNRRYDARTARCNEQLNVLMVHHDSARFKRGVMKRTADVCGSARLNARLVYHVDRVIRRFDSRRMRIEHNSVARGEHSDRVADYRFAGVGARRYRADYSERSHFDKRKPFISRPRGGFDIFRSRSHLSREPVLHYLVSDVAHTRFFHAHASENFGVFDRLFSYIGDNFLPCVERHFLND